ncbi:PHP domain-containing protein [Paenibacillus cremeus]|uniref:PHP domain-containing protein n=2 Tax=Paenibacillus cremeus TaxID=2163881 RepID=A0A559KFZ9_9BACL|nr:PHP domain-containing protein [Paenibacillus cremeus]
MRWLPFELHTHTFHSDGKQSLLELAEGAKELGLAGVALTDHNTMTGLADRERVVEQTGVEVIRGLEWTTFFGHMVTLGIQDYVDWRNLSPFHIHRGIEGVHRQGGLVGVAHPFRVGSPMCTGCFWEFEVSDWAQVDYIEVWSGLFPSIRRNNERAFAFWTELLNQGHRISATCGRDWHVAEPPAEPIAATFLAIPAEETMPGPLAGAALAALGRGAAAISMGPLPLISIRSDSSAPLAGIGEVIETQAAAPTVQLELSVDFSVREGLWELQKPEVELRITSNLGTLMSCELSQALPKVVCPLKTQGLAWIRGELYGVFHGARTMIGFTNPIYFEH